MLKVLVLEFRCNYRDMDVPSSTLMQHGASRPLIEQSCSDSGPGRVPRTVGSPPHRVSLVRTKVKHHECQDEAANATSCNKCIAISS